MTRIPRVGFGGLLCAALVLSAWHADAQAVYGSISTTILDSSGAAVPAAKIMISDTARAVSYTGATNDSGFYSQTHLLIGDYKTDRPAPRRPEDAPPKYVAQLALYRAVLGKIYPGREVRAALLWTDSLALMEQSV